MPIVLITDGSSAFAEAAETAFRFAKLWDCPVHAFIILDAGLANLLGDEWISSSSSRKRFSDWLDDALHKGASQIFEELNRKASTANISLQTAIKYGKPAKVIAELGSLEGTLLLILPHPGTTPGEIPPLQMKIDSLLKKICCPLLIAGHR